MVYDEMLWFIFGEALSGWTVSLWCLDAANVHLLLTARLISSHLLQRRWDWKQSKGRFHERNDA